jgi:hypothetical protein
MKSFRRRGVFETWAPIPGYEGRWEASTEGRIRSLPRRRTRGGVLKPRVNKRGYLSLVLGRETHEVHRLVALAFLGPRPEGGEVRHVDGNPLNPRLSNLTYGTRSENGLDKRAHGGDHNVKKTHCPQGHPYDAENTYVLPSRPRARYCKACQRARSLKRYRAKVASAPDFREEWRA